ncbi:MAG: hypothetical protein RI563_04955 [Thiohalophilus sp.]|uniref:hypothetical protein n=1 Tax=Thiohalophilus sp. TaxID=3028392 RepID=UPI00287087D6|nr:hypothetical protein [Thiohalophilus sp.]MDR9436202.1 hypothetical protein [Thiohalophilus sp.]
MNQEEEIMQMINLLAGAAQAGAQGVLAQAAFNLMRASEAVVKARKMQMSDTFQQAAMDQLLSARQTLFQALELPDAMNEARQDIIDTGRVTYNPEQ